MNHWTTLSTRDSQPKALRTWVSRLFLCGFFVFAAQTGNAVEIRVAHALSDDSHVGRALAKAAEQVSKESAGRLVLKPVGKGALGNDQKAMQDVIDGKLEMFISSTSTVVPIYKPLAILDAPFLFANREEAHALLDGKVGQELLAGMQGHGMVGLSFWELGFRHLTNNARPVTRLADLQGLKLRTMPTELAISTFKRLGADAKPLPFPELRPAIEAGTFDGQENPLPTIVSAKLHEVQKYLTITKHLYGVYGVIASKKWWDTLSEADKTLVSKALADARVFQRAESQRATDEALKVMKDAGMKVAELEVGERSQIERRLERVIAPIVQQAGMTLWIRLADELSQIRAAKK
ncbi:DctP family TRAP transporter solute-binding subunit [Hydrogenophaga soli]